MLKLLGIMLLMATPSPSAEACEGSADMRRARDGNIAIQQELEAARLAGTVEAYDLFIARHPNHPLAKTAHKERALLASKSQSAKP